MERGGGGGGATADTYMPFTTDLQGISFWDGDWSLIFSRRGHNLVTIELYRRTTTLQFKRRCFPIALLIMDTSKGHGHSESPVKSSIRMKTYTTAVSFGRY